MSEWETGFYFFALDTARISLEICYFSIRKFCPDTVWRLGLFLRSFWVLNKDCEENNRSASVACCFPAYAPRHQVASPGLTSTGKLSLETTGTSWSQLGLDPASHWLFKWMDGCECLHGKYPCSLHKGKPSVPISAKVKWQHHMQVQKESIQEEVCGLLLPSHFSAAKSKLLLQNKQTKTKNRLPGTQQGSSWEKLIPHLLVLAVWW